ncbi:MAG: pyrroline-5-carboxylate reductase [bacterium]
MNKKIAFIGAGNMGEALIKGLVQSKVVKPESITAADKREDRLLYLQSHYCINVEKNNISAAKNSDIVILATKPHVIERVLQEIQDVITEEKLIISIAAGISLATLKKHLSGEARVIRCMPNTPALVLKGITVICQDDTEEKDLITAKNLFESVGTVMILEEKYINIVTAISGSGPAYYFLIVEAIADGGVRMGLSKSTALLLATETMQGASSLLKETHKHPAELKDMVTSPAGTTSYGLYQLEKGGIRGALIDAIESACNRSKELGSNKG